MDIEGMVARGAGVISRRQLAAAGWDRAEQRRLVRTMARVRDGWYAAPGADPAAVAAVRAGGALTCTDVLWRLGAWRPVGAQRVHARFAAAEDRTPGVVAHVLPGPRRPVVEAVDDAEDAASCLVKCQPVVDAVAILDSALRAALILPDDLARALAANGKRGRDLAARLDPMAESGIESHLRMILRGLGVRWASQVSIWGVGRVDFLVADLLVIEADGIAHHAGAQVQGDRDRDNALQRLGFHVLRFTYADIVGRPDYVREVIGAVIARREHRWSKRTRTWEREGRPDPVVGQRPTPIAEQWAVCRERLQKPGYRASTSTISEAAAYPGNWTGRGEPAA